MNIFKQTKHYTSITRTLLFSIGILLSCNVFAVKPSLDAEVKQNTRDIATNAQSITDNSTAIGLNAGGITKNSIDIGLNTGGITDNSNAIGRHAGDIIENSIDIGRNKRNISDNHKDIANLQNALPAHYIGEQYAGGKIFYLDASGQHGLIAALVDQTSESGTKWYNGDYKDTGATGDGLWAGKMNTTIIISTQIGDLGNGIFAAKLAADYSVQDDGVTACTIGHGLDQPPEGEICHGDWYLPSKIELNLLYQQKSEEDGFANDLYWSSSESNSNDAWYQTFYYGYQYRYDKDVTCRVRAVRAF